MAGPAPGATNPLHQLHPWEVLLFASVPAARSPSRLRLLPLWLPTAVCPLFPWSLLPRGCSKTPRIPTPLAPSSGQAPATCVGITEEASSMVLQPPLSPPPLHPPLTSSEIVSLLCSSPPIAPVSLRVKADILTVAHRPSLVYLPFTSAFIPSSSPPRSCCSSHASLLGVP